MVEENQGEVGLKEELALFLPHNFTHGPWRSGDVPGGRRSGVLSNLPVAGGA